MVTVFTKPNCIQCEMTKKWLDREGISYEVVDIAENKKAFDMVVEMGYLAAPVVMTDKTSWSGFKPDKLKSLSR